MPCRMPTIAMHEISDLTHSSGKVREVVDRFAKVLGEHMAGNRTTEVSAYNTREAVNNSGWAVSTLDAALWAFNTTESFEEGLIAAVNLEYKLCKKLCQLIPFNRHIYIQQLCTVIKPVKMSVKVKYFVIMRICGVIYTVAKPANPVKHWYLHFLNKTVFSVVIA